jgi:MFS family permease
MVESDFRRSRLAVAALFFFLGFQYATWTARLPALQARLHLSTAAIGVLLLVVGVGAAVAFPLVAVLMKRLGSRWLAVVATLVMVLCLVGFGAAPNYAVLLVVMCCDGVAVACLDVAINAQGAALEATYQRTAMGKLHATFSGGSLVAALVASGITRLTPNLAVHLGVVAVALVLLIGYARPGLLAEDLAPPAKEAHRRFATPSRLTLLLGFAMVFGTVAEGAMNDWSSLYLKNVADASAALAPLGIAVFSATMVLARVFADGWRARWGDRRVVLVGSVLAGLGLAAGVLAGGLVPALLGFACVGLGIAAVTPCVYVAAATQGSNALTLVSTMGVTGMLAGPPVIGAVANGGGLAWGLGVVAVAAIGVAVCAAPIRWPVAVGSEH